MKSDCLVDTDVFIDFLRGRSEAVEFVRSKFPRIHISAITVGELYSGIREGAERRTLESALNACHVIDVSMNIAIMAGLFRRAYGKSHSVSLADALIAATAKEYGLSLASLNVKHFPMFQDAFAPYSKQQPCL